MAKNVGAESKKDKYLRAMFADPDAPGAVLSANEKAELTFYRALFVFINSQPWHPDSSLVNWIRQYYKDSFGDYCSKAVAMADLAFVKSLLGNIKAPKKDFMLYQVSQMLLAQYNDPQATITEKIHAAKELGKIYKLDKPDEQEIPWDQLMAKIEITLKPEDIGLPAIEDIKQLEEKLRLKYLAPFAEDAVVVESTPKTEE